MFVQWQSTQITLTSYLAPADLLVYHIRIQLPRQPLHSRIEHAVCTCLPVLLAAQVGEYGYDDGEQDVDGAQVIIGSQLGPRQHCCKHQQPGRADLEQPHQQQLRSIALVLQGRTCVNTRVAESGRQHKEGRVAAESLL